MGYGIAGIIAGSLAVRICRADRRARRPGHTTNYTVNELLFVFLEVSWPIRYWCI